MGKLLKFSGNNIDRLEVAIPTHKPELIPPVLLHRHLVSSGRITRPHGPAIHGAVAQPIKKKGLNIPD